MSKLKIQKYYLTNNDCYKKGKRRTPIGIQIHSIGCAQGTAKSVADYWNQSGIQACVTYICDADVAGNVLQILPEDYYTWADAGYGNRNLITIEIAESDFMQYTGGASYKILNEAKFKEDILRGYDTAVELCAEICKRYKWDPFTKLPSGLYLISSHNEGRMAGLSSAHVDTSHIWPQFGLSMDTFRQAVKNVMSGKEIPDISPIDKKYYRVRKSWTDEKSQIGAYEIKQNAIDNCPAGYGVYDWNGKEVHYVPAAVVSGTQAFDFEGLSESAAAKKILELIHNCDKSGILYSVTAAQMILESGYVTTSLAKAANNCFGMKTTLSGNTWESVWDGQSKVNHLTWEVYNGKTVQIYADFRKYPCIEDSVRDHAAYLLGAKNGAALRYAGLTKAKNYTEAITIIRNNGYATDPNYISKICSIIQRFGLDKYDKELTDKIVEEPVTPLPVKKSVIYRVQVGLYKKKTNAVRKQKGVKAETGYDCAIEEVDGQYFVMCGSYKLKHNAENRVKKLKEFGIDAFVKEFEI